MKKIMNFVLMAVLAVCFVLPAAGKAEAAKLAVVPLANHVEDNTTYCKYDLHGRDHGYV